MNNSVILARLLPFVPALIIAACSTTTTRWEEPEPKVLDEQTAATDLPRSKWGNPPFYEVYGQRYTVMPTSQGYSERGVASWYGKKFHGRSTSSGERYDMHAMTAAHKTLPLPTNVRVTNLETGKSIIVRVNDRGPFVKNRLIDLSYAAAKELDVVTHGTALVEVVALGAPGVRAARTGVSPENPPDTVRMYLQVGAFGDRANAEKLAAHLSRNGVAAVRVYEAAGESPSLYRVRVGPVDTVEAYDRVAQQVERLQVAESHLVVETAATNESPTVRGVSGS